MIGIGQSLRGDDAVGPLAVRLWQESFPETANRPEIRVQMLELPGTELLSELNGMQAAVLVDAVQSSSPAGTIHRFALQDVLAFAPGSQSAHGWGVAETLELGLTLYPSLANLRLVWVGLSAKQFEMGSGLSHAVADAIPETTRVIQHEVSALLINGSLSSEACALE